MLFLPGFRCPVTGGAAGAIAKDEAKTHNNEGEYGGHLDHGKPIFKLTQTIYLHGIERHQSG